MEKHKEQRTLKIDALNKYARLDRIGRTGRTNKLQPLVRPEAQIERVLEILSKKGKNNPCLIGDSGLMKIAIAEGVAQDIAKSFAPYKLLYSKVFSLDISRVIAGSSSRGEFEERLMQLVDEVRGSDGEIILFIEEAHTLFAAGSGELSAANILKPAFTNGMLKCIFCTTKDEYAKYVEKDLALKRRLQMVEVPEPSLVEAIEILEGLREKYETHHHVEYSNKALIAAAGLSILYISEPSLPYKAIDLIDEAGATARVQISQPQNSEKPIITEMDMVYVISARLGFSVHATCEQLGIFLDLAFEICI